MFAALKSLLSNHVAPGGSHVSVSPFAFLVGTRIDVRANAGDEARRTEAIVNRLMEVDRLLDNDCLPEGRERVKDLLRELTE
jgi:hypothetical protein